MALNTKQNHTNNNSINLSPAWTYRHSPNGDGLQLILNMRKGANFCKWCLKCPFGVLDCDHSCYCLRLGGHQWWMLWSSGMEPCCPPSGTQDLQVGCCGMSDASVGDVAAHEGSRQTTPSSSSGVVVLDTCHLDNLLILMLEQSMADSWVSGSPIRKCPGKDRRGVDHWEEHKGVFSIKKCPGEN